MKHGVSQQDLKFKRAIESCDFPVDAFDHPAHIRLAYIYLAETASVEKAVARVRAALLGLLSHVGVDPTDKYHETMTEAWLQAVYHFMHECGDTESSKEFIAENPKLLNSKIMLSHYSEALLFSKEARASFISPDLAPIPQHA